MTLKPFSEKQLLAMTWWCEESKHSDCDAIICDGAVRSGKTMSMALSFILWAFYRFTDSSFAICSKTIRSVRRNVTDPVLNVLRENGFEVEDRLSSNYLQICCMGRVNRFYLFGGRDESSAALIQGVTLSGVLLDEVALMPRSFVEQALARCSVSGSKLWFNCNPEYPGHWFYREWIRRAKSKNALYIRFFMEDNPALSPRTIQRYKRMYTGAFYRRFVKGEWVAADGAVYPFMTDPSAFCAVPDKKFEQYIISCDYGTVNPASFGLWGKYNEVWYRIDEYYYDSKKHGVSRTDEEHYSALHELAGGRQITAVTVDPSAASFIETIRRHGEYEVFPAINSVTDGIRRVSTALRQGHIRICGNCEDSVREFSLYRWDGCDGVDRPVKENDHAMDDIRYFVSTFLSNGSGGFAAVAADRRTGCETIF